MFHKMPVISWLGEELLASQEGFCSMELVVIECAISKKIVEFENN